MKRSFALSLLLLCCAIGASHARQLTPGSAAAAPPPEPALAALAPDAGLQDDPAYGKYKEGYNAVLDEEWREAVKRFDVVLEKYPKSEYRDDAAYWRAYALMHFDRKQANEAYKKFAKEYKQSSYYDDAMADLEQLNASVVVVPGSKNGATVYVGPDSYAYGYDTEAPDSVDAPEAMRLDGRRLTAKQLKELAGKVKLLEVPMPALAPMPPIPNNLTVTSSGRSFGMHFATPRAEFESEIDAESQLKIDALRALGDGREDDRSYEAVRKVATNRAASIPLRVAALDVLSDFKKHDPMPVFTEIVKSDTSEELQAYALDYIGSHGKDRNKSVQTLIELYNSMSKSRSEMKQQIFYQIAEVGNDKAVDFLSGVARSGSDYELRRQAVYYLGTMGSERARSALLDIMESTPKK